MNPQPFENEKKGSVPALITLDMAEMYALVRASEPQRDLPPPDPDLRLHTVGQPMTELTLSQASTAPLFLQLQPSHETILPVPVLKLRAARGQPVAMTLWQLD